MSCGCENECGEKVVKIKLGADAPKEIVDLVSITSKVATDYQLAVAGVKKRTTEARKGLMKIKKMTTDMRKMVLVKCNKARESSE